MTEITESAAEHRPPDAPDDASLVAGTGLTKFLDPLRIPPLLRPKPGPGADLLTIKLQEAKLKLHSQLLATPLWTYAGHCPGPTIEVRRGQRLRVNWANQIDGHCPVVAVEVDYPPDDPPPPYFPQPGNTPGRAGVAPDPKVTKLRPWTAVHLHGARTNAGDDGIPENAVLPATRSSLST